MKKKIIASLLLFPILVGCSYPADITQDPVWDYVEVSDILKDKIKGKCSDNVYNIDVDDLTDDKVNPYYKTWEQISLYPTKEYQDHKFELIGFNIYSEVSETVIFHVYIKDEVIEYEIEIEEVYNEETGETTFIEHKTEVDRYTETIDLIEGGRKITLNSDKPKFVDFYVDYVIKDYSATTSFDIVVTDLQGNSLTFEWGIDDLDIIVSELNAN